MGFLFGVLKGLAGTGCFSSYVNTGQVGVLSALSETCGARFGHCICESLSEVDTRLGMYIFSIHARWRTDVTCHYKLMVGPSGLAIYH